MMKIFYLYRKLIEKIPPELHHGTVAIGQKPKKKKNHIDENTSSLSEVIFLSNGLVLFVLVIEDYIIILWLDSFIIFSNDFYLHLSDMTKQKFNQIKKNDVRENLQTQSLCVYICMQAFVVICFCQSKMMCCFYSIITDRYHHVLPYG